jgi:hypothetical protein
MLIKFEPDSRGSSPAMTVERKFANVFMDFSASENTRVIKSRKGEALSGIELALRLAGMTAAAIRPRLRNLKSGLSSVDINRHRRC